MALPLRLFLCAVFLVVFGACDEIQPGPRSALDGSYELRSYVEEGEERETPNTSVLGYCAFHGDRSGEYLRPETGRFELDGDRFELSFGGPLLVTNGSPGTDTLRVAGTVEAYGSLLLLTTAAGDTLAAAVSPTPRAPTTITVADARQSLSSCDLFRFAIDGATVSSMFRGATDLAGDYDLIGAKLPGWGRPEGLPVLVNGYRHFREMVEGGALTLADGIYGLELIVRTDYNSSTGVPPRPTRDTTRVRGRYISGGPIVLFQGPQPVFGIIEGQTLATSGYLSPTDEAPTGADLTIRDIDLLLRRQDGE